MKKVVCLMVALIYFINCVQFAKASEKLEERINVEYGLEVVAASTADRIESLVKENADLKKELRNSSVTTATIANVNNRINRNKERMKALGAKTPSDDFLLELIEAGMKNNEMKGTNDWVPSQLVTQFSSMYDMSASYTTTYGGNVQYHLIFQYKGSDPYLDKYETQSFAEDMTPGSAAAQRWVNEIIKVYAEKLVGEGLGLINPYLNLIPYELLGLAAKPSANTISGSGSANIVTVGATTTQKFVYVYDASVNSWFYALSTNQVLVATTITQRVAINGINHQSSDDYNGIWMYGDYHRSMQDANSAFAAGSPYKTCIYKVASYSTEEVQDIVTLPIHTPTFVAHMV